jgi:NAD(P)H-dependent flavin oxidoreductase YrpB (nitropropane dioxygenase family)
MRTQLSEMLGVEFPIVAFSHCRDVVAAVTRAGGLGVLGAVMFTPEELETELAWIDSQVGDLPYGVDTLIPASFAGREEGGHDAATARSLVPARHQEFVDDLLARHGVPPLPPDASEASTHRHLDVTAQAGGQLLDVAFAHSNVRLVANALGPAPASFVDAAHAHGVLVAGLVGTVAHAHAQVNAGVDVVVAQGYEAGGHTGQISTMVLVPQVVDAVAPVPVLAAGGVASGRQAAAALALGAQGVWCGSVWLTTEEAETHLAVREKFLAASSSDTVRSRASTGKPARQLRSAWTDAWDDPANPDPLPMPLHSTLIDEAQARLSRHASNNEGARELITFFVGQVVGQLNRVKPAKQVVLEIVEEYIDTIERMSATLHVD